MDNILTKQEEDERLMLLALQSDNRRWFSQEEYDRLKELNKKKFETSKSFNEN